MDTKIDRSNCPGITTSKASGTGRDNKTEREVRILSGISGSAVYGVHNPSFTNLIRGVAERVLFTPNSSGELERPVQAETDIFKQLGVEKLALLKHTPPTRVVDLREFPELYTDSRKRVVYRNAVASLEMEGITRRDSFVTAFVKAEKVNFTAKPDPAPRVIQPRTARYNAMLGCYLKPLEKQLLGSYLTSYGYNVVVKGMNAAEVANQIAEHWSSYRHPVALGLDASRFDQHVGSQALEFEHSIYNSIFGQDKQLAKLLRWQINNVGYGYASGKRIKYNVRGCRMSGDMNTSMGNCIIMSSIVLAYFRVNRIQAKLVNNGDDCVVICESNDLNRFDNIGAWFKRFGFKLTQEQPVYDMERIEFCQTQPILCQDGWRMVRNPYTASSKDALSLLSWSTRLMFDRWRGAISSCGLSLTRGVPFWEAYYQRIGGVQHERTNDTLRNSGLGYMASRMNSEAIITPESRYSFWKAFNLLPDEQIALENLDVDIDYSAARPLIFGDIEPLHPILQHGKN